MAPDLFSFGPFFLTNLPMILHRWGSRQRMEPPDPSIIPSYVYHAYNVTHSLVVWAVVVIAIWLIARRQHPSPPPSPFKGEGVRVRDGLALWPFGAWALHILCDIPTHSTRFFPTPYLWPLSTPLVDGRPWSRPPFMLINYGLMALAYVSIYLYKSRQKKT